MHGIRTGVQPCRQAGSKPDFAKPAVLLGGMGLGMG
jgi:hypothetical protein